MECTICNFQCNYESELEKHLNGLNHKLAIKIYVQFQLQQMERDQDFQKQLGELNLKILLALQEKEKAIMREELTIQREQNLKNKLHENNQYQIELERKVKKRHEKINEVIKSLKLCKSQIYQNNNIKLSHLKSKKYINSCENQSHTILSEVSILFDSIDESFISANSCESCTKIFNHIQSRHEEMDEKNINLSIIEKKFESKTNLESNELENKIEINEFDNNSKIQIINQIISIESINEFDNNNSKNISIESKNYFVNDSSLNQYEEIIKKFNISFFDFVNNDKIPCRKKAYCIIFKNLIPIDIVVKYSYYLRGYKNSKSEVFLNFDNENFHIIMYEIEDPPKFLLRSKFYPSEMKISYNDMYIGYASKEKKMNLQVFLKTTHQL